MAATTVDTIMEAITAGIMVDTTMDTTEGITMTDNTMDIMAIITTIIMATIAMGTIMVGAIMGIGTVVQIGMAILVFTTILTFIIIALPHHLFLMLRQQQRIKRNLITQLQRHLRALQSSFRNRQQHLDNNEGIFPWFGPPALHQGIQLFRPFGAEFLILFFPIV